MRLKSPFLFVYAFLSHINIYFSLCKIYSSKFSKVLIPKVDFGDKNFVKIKKFKNILVLFEEEQRV